MEIQVVTGLIDDYNLVSGYTGGAPTAHESTPAPATLFVSAATGDLRLAAPARSRSITAWRPWPAQRTGD